jgi:hypothetical protein
MLTDLIRFSFINIPPLTVRMSEVGITWPPPEYIMLELRRGTMIVRQAEPGDDRELVFQRSHISKLTAEEAIEGGFQRGAEYSYEHSTTLFDKRVIN